MFQTAAGRHVAMAGNGIIDAPALATITNSKQDPGFAFFYNALGVPESASANYNLGSFLARSGQFAEAERYLRAAIEADPKNAAAHQALAQVLAGLGRTDEPRKEIEMSKGLD
jgi:Flp pilus assembly protein TadD